MKVKEAVFRVLDTETTGLDPNVSGVCEIAFRDWSPTGGTMQEMESLVESGYSIPPEVSAIHGLTDKDVVGAPYLGAVMAPFVGDDVVWCAFNTAFDWGFVRPPPGLGHLCIYRLSCLTWPNAPKHSNQVLRYWLELDVGLGRGGAHTAMGDVRVSVGVLEKALIAGGWLERELGELYEELRKPIVQKHMRFGSKHYGTAWKDVPLDYLQWMDRKVHDLDTDTRWNLEEELRRRKA